MEAAATRLSAPAGMRRVAVRLDRVAGSAVFAYGSVLALQAKVLWGIWHYRDLSAGDTSNYFIYATGWADHRWLDPLFSPIYTMFWGSLIWVIQGTYAVTIAHRMIIVLAATALVLVVLRRLLTPGVAWLIAVWWTVLPVNYDTLNEIHLFSLLPALLAVWVALRYSGPRMRAAVFGILLAAALMQRNEFLVAALGWLILCLGYELRSWRLRARAPGTTGPWRPFAALGAATLAVAVLALLTVWRSPSDLSVGGWWNQASYKQDFALCQHYAVGYQQRHHADENIGWRDCQTFMQRDFGSPTPSFTEALTSNPSAMATHFGWNLRLSPYAMQLALFDATSGSQHHDPDYIHVHTGSGVVLVASLLVALFTGLGLYLLWRRRRAWRQGWLTVRAWGWGVLGALAAMGVWVAITTHPRPAYLFPLTFGLLAVIGIAAMAIVERWPQLSRLRIGIPVAAVLLILLVPSHYGRGYSTPVLGSGRGAADMVSRLGPYRDQLGGKENVLLGPYSFEACNYLIPEGPCTPTSIGLSGPGGITPAAWLDRNHVDFIYADRTILQKRRPMLEGLERHGWYRLSPASESDWLLLRRGTEPGAQSS